jgi:hypothetical protein
VKINLKSRSLLKRRLRFWWQRRIRGWDDSELWSLDATLIDWFLPRLKRYREITYGYPGSLGSMEEWHVILDHVIWAMEQYQHDDWMLHLSEEDRERAAKGFELFGVWLRGMWL